MQSHARQTSHARRGARHARWPMIGAGGAGPAGRFIGCNYALTWRKQKSKTGQVSLLLARGLLRLLATVLAATDGLSSGRL